MKKIKKRKENGRKKDGVQNFTGKSPLALGSPAFLVVAFDLGGG
jgi:hypothetical protein